MKLLRVVVEKEMLFFENHTNHTPVPKKNDYGCKKNLWKEERVRLVLSSSGSSSTTSYSSEASSPNSYSSRSTTPQNHQSGTSIRSSTPPRYSLGASTPQSYSLGPSRNAECSNCKHLLGKITVLEATVEMYMHPGQHTLNLAALLHEVYNDMRKLSLE
nr:hypothetical protein [Tanacetum cinerariifolium]